jgi:hypothetical protein
MHRLEQLITAVTEQLRLLAATRLREEGMVDVAASTDSCAARPDFPDDRSEQ